ncbi:MAG: tRNA (adenosine(37)-N6)-threonylcarbamoyltransferase complex dimerization subunit type 1 TsaB [Eubacteriales bacterium]
MVLALESSANACSVALCEGENLLAQYFLNSGLTHSKTLLPLIIDVLSKSEVTLQEIDCLAVAVGPGSFTGLRIGLATIKGLSMSGDIPCIPCSTLASMAWQLSHLEGYTLVPVMDARRNQVYTSLFLVEEGVPKRLCPDKAISIAELSEELKHIKTKKILLGDGADLCYGQLEDILIAPPHLRLQMAWGVAQESFRQKENALSGENLLPEYHRLSQAERERQEKAQA